MRNPANPNTKESMQKVFAALWEAIQTTDWKIELRYFIGAAVILTIVATVALYLVLYFFYYDMLFAGWIVGWFNWLIRTSVTSHEARKREVRNIIQCLDPLPVFDDLQPSISRQKLILKHEINIKEFTMLAIIQRLHVILGFLLFSVGAHIYGIIFRLDPQGAIGMYIIGIIVAVFVALVGYYEDMKFHFFSVVPTDKKFLWIYTFFVFLICLVGITALYLSVYFIARQVLPQMLI